MTIKNADSKNSQNVFNKQKGSLNVEPFLLFYLVYFTSKSDKYRTIISPGDNFTFILPCSIIGMS